MILSWGIDHSDNFPLVTEVLAPRYVIVIGTYDRMLAEKKTIGPNDPGFAEISQIVEGKLTGTGDLTIARIGIVDTGWGLFSTDKGLESHSTITLQLVLRNGRSLIQKNVPDLQPEIQQFYRDAPLFMWNQIAFWPGVALGISSLIMGLIQGLKSS